GAVGGQHALDLARTAWQRDSSYAVRASALTSLVRLDTVGRRELVLRGLSTPSYRDAIQNAALVAIARGNDTTMMADVQRIVGEQPLPIRVLATLASHGNQHALDLLTADLNDDRAWVRTWTLAAFTAFDPPRRLPALEGALPRLTHADTRAAVQRAIAALRAAPRR
ncbi:MAG TPA: hypothetical protein VFJ20_01900, partial [Gemmatimonadaceae bacterium]|nr:hypothetical protein [Gemmatimonadaceae bacterium]